MRQRSVIGSVIVGVLLIGCGTPSGRLYPGPALPRDQVASFKRAATSRVLAIDGRQVDGWEWEVAPGPHELFVSVVGQAPGPYGTVVVWRPCTVDLETGGEATCRAL